MIDAEATPLAGKVAVVTGAGSGIGRAIALALARAGAEVRLLGRSLEKLQQVAARLPRTACSGVDLGDDRQLADLAAALAHEYGDGIDCLIHSAGSIAHGPLARADIAAFDQQFRINLRAPYVLTQALLPSLQRKAGQIVFINSAAGLVAAAGAAQYSATKFGLRGIADALRDELSGTGLRVMSVFVGRTATPMQAAVCAYEGRAYRPEQCIQPTDVASLVVQALTLPPTVEVTALHLRAAAPGKMSATRGKA